MIETMITVIRAAIAAAAIDNRIPAQANCRLRREGARIETMTGYGLSGIRLGLGADFDKPKSGGSGGMTWLGYQNVR
jgi:hypothetical protein